ncbi:MAG: hypothetical protein ACE147_00755 [Candidatus Methylomirabilales bacterium]
MEEPKSLAEFLAADVLRKHLGISREVLLAWTAKGLPYIRVGTRLYFHEPAVASWLKRQETTRQPE